VCGCADESCNGCACDGTCTDCQCGGACCGK
jgi:hypothetical protein